MNLYICYFTPQKGIKFLIRWPAKESALYYPRGTNEIKWVQKNIRKDRRVNERRVTVKEEAGDFLHFVIVRKLLYNVVLFSAVQNCISVIIIYILSLLRLPFHPVTPFIPPPLGHKWFWEYGDLVHDCCFETGDNRSRGKNCNQTGSDRHPGNRDHSPTAARIPASNPNEWGHEFPPEKSTREAAPLNLEVSLIVKLLNCRIIK